MNVEKYKTILVLFEPFQGGNHLANLMSTSQRIQNRIDIDDYHEYLQVMYSQMNGNVHFGQLVNIEVGNNEKLISTIQNSNKPVLICGHISESFHVLELIKSQGPLGIINFECYNLSQHVLYRMNIFQNQSYLKHLLEWSHRADVVSSTFNIDPADMYNVTASQLFQADISELITQINRDLELNLDLEFCKELHELWYTRTKTDYEIKLGNHPG